jgi:hypothetical protein
MLSERLRYLRDLRRATRRGFPSRRAMHRFEAHRDDPAALLALPEGAREHRGLSDAALRRARCSTVVALEDAGLPPNVEPADVRFWFPGSLGPTVAERTHVRPSDDHVRLRFLAVEQPDEVMLLPIRGSRSADAAAADLGVQWDYLHARASEADLRALAGHRYGGRTVLSDPTRLRRLANGGQFVLDVLYRALVA